MNMPVTELRLDDSTWDGFWSTRFQDDGIQLWLVEALRRLENVKRALVLFENAEGSGWVPLAVWPPLETDLERVAKFAEVLQRSGEPLFEKIDSEKTLWVLAAPLQTGDHLLGAVVVEVNCLDAETAEDNLRCLQWASGWPTAQIEQRRQSFDQSYWERSVFALDLLATVAEEKKPAAAALAAANELQRHFECDRVSVGLIKKPGKAGANKVRLEAISNTAWFRRRSSSVDLVENAMEEALDQHRTVAVPADDKGATGVNSAHQRHLEESRNKVALTAVLAKAGIRVGAITIERKSDTPFTDTEWATLEAIADLLGPYFYMQKRQWRWLSGRLPDLVGRMLRAVFGAERPSVKLAVLAFVAFVGFVSFYKTNMRVSADAVLEGAQQRTATMPFQGFIANAEKRAGDLVSKGDVLAKLDVRDMELERDRWTSEYAQLQQEKRKALSTGDRSALALMDAQLAQARAKILLNTSNLKRAAILSPSDGIVIAGDWSQKIGAPIEKGQELFTVAPLSEYRVIVKVDERDIALVKQGQAGNLLLAGRSDARLDIKIKRMTSVAIAEDGKNLFRVEATLQDDVSGIRPGMEGIVKIDVGIRAIGWIWTRSLVAWSKRTLWRWTP